MFDLARVSDKIDIQRDWFKDYRFHLVSSAEQLSKLVDICIERNLCSLDCECTGVDNRVYKDEYFNDGIVSRHGIRTVDRVVGLCISFDGVNGYYIPLSHEVEDAGNLPWDPSLNEIERLCNNSRVIFHNAKFDNEFLYPLVNIEMWDSNQFEDTMIMARVISPNKAGMPGGLKPLTKKFYNIDMIELGDLFTKEMMDQLKKEKQAYNFAYLHPKEGLEYGCSDGIFTYKLFFTLNQMLQESDNTIYKLEKNFCNVMRKMERNRVHIDVNRVNQLYTECKAAMIEVGDKIRGIIENKTGNTGRWRTLNIGSPKQLSEALITDPEGLRLKPTSDMAANGEGGFSSTAIEETDEEESGDKQVSLADEALKSLDKAYGKKLTIRFEGKDISLFMLVIDYRHYDKMKGSYVEKLHQSHDVYGDVRPSFNQLGADTARLTCKAGKIEDGYSGVNFQGIPRDSDDDKPELFKQIRTIIVPREGKMMVKIDYAGEELRVVTNMSGDKIWTKSFLYEDGDVHSITAKSLFQKASVSKDERNRGKRSNFAIIYGGGAGAIQRNIGCSMEDAQRSMSNMRKDLPELMGYVDHQKRFAKKHKCVYTAYGRRMPIPTIDSPNQMIRRKAERCAINYTIQATAADILKFAMCFVDKMLRKHGWSEICLYILTVHDEIVFEIPPEYLMEIVPKLDEWMTLPWKLEKRHGRQWTVPLETEPGIDIHWRARYDFFLMTRGTKADEKDIDSEGKFTGKLKKDQIYENGRIYQAIPDFLADHIYRLPVDGKELPKSSTPEPKKIKEPEEPEEPESPKESEESETEDEEKVEMDNSEIDIPGIDSEDDLPPEPSKIENTESKDPQEISPSANGYQVSQSNYVLRWTLRAVPSESVIRKMHAVCILSEGSVPLRVINHKDSIVISEDNGIRVNPEKFRFLADLFGLG